MRLLRLAVLVKSRCPFDNPSCRDQQFVEGRSPSRATSSDVPCCVRTSRRWACLNKCVGPRQLRRDLRERKGYFARIHRVQRHFADETRARPSGVTPVGSGGNSQYGWTEVRLSARPLATRRAVQRWRRRFLLACRDIAGSLWIRPEPDKTGAGGGRCSRLGTQSHAGALLKVSPRRPSGPLWRHEDRLATHRR